MWRSLDKLLVIFLLLSCKQPVAQLLAEQQGTLYDNLLREHKYLTVSMQQEGLNYVISLEKLFAKALKEGALNSKQHQEIQKILHKIRSIISYAVHSRCFKEPHIKLSDGRHVSISKSKFPLDTRTHNIKKSWQDRYDYNFYQRNNKDYKYQLVIANDSLCSVFLNKLAELVPEQIDLTQPNEKFFESVMDDNIKSMTTPLQREAQQNFFRKALIPHIVKITAQSMAQADYLFPFHQQDWVKACAATRDYYDEDKAGPGRRMYRYDEEVRKKIDCHILQKLPQVEITTHAKVDCADSGFHTHKSMYTQPFAQVQALSAAVNTTMQGLNKARAKLDELVEMRELDKFKTTKVKHYDIGSTYNEPNYYTPHVEKKPWILPFMKVLNATKIEDNPPVIRALDTYNCYLVTANKQGILPVIFAQATQQATGSVHLNHMGRFFGFGKVQYKPLKLPSTQTITKAVHELKNELIDNWVAMQATQVSTKKIAAEKIYATILNNELATAQLLLQNTEHTVIINDLVREFQHKPITPKWLRTFKKFAIGADLAFIPIAILGGFIAGGVGIVPILLMANAVNFLWIGAATAEEIVARNRYRMIERSLMTGNSEQIERSMKLLRTMHEKRRNLIVSGGVGTTMTLANLSLIVRGIDGFTTLPIDVTAAFSSDVEIFSLPEEEMSDADMHKDR